MPTLVCSHCFWGNLANTCSRCDTFTAMQLGQRHTLIHCMPFDESKDSWINVWHKSSHLNCKNHRRHREERAGYLVSEAGLNVLQTFQDELISPVRWVCVWCKEERDNDQGQISGFCFKQCCIKSWVFMIPNCGAHPVEYKFAILLPLLASQLLDPFWNEWMKGTCSKG